MTPNAVAEDPLLPSVVYAGPSDRAGDAIYVGVTGDGDPSGTEVAVTRNGVAVPVTKSVAGPGLVRLDLANPTDGTYAVRATPHDASGNSGPTVTHYVRRGAAIMSMNAYGPFEGGAFTASGDVDGDGRAEIITAAGPGGGPHVRVFGVDEATAQATVVASFMAYDERFTGGVRVATADVDGDGTDEIVTAPGPGGGPNVRVWHTNAVGDLSLVASFMAYAADQTAGVYVAGGDTNADATDEIVTAPDSGASPLVRAFDVNGTTAREVAGFMAYDARFAGGVRVAAADVDSDGAAEIVTGAGPGGGPHVQVFSVGNGQPTVRYSFMAYDPRFTGGVTVAAGDVDGHGDDELLLSAGVGGGPHVRVLGFASGMPMELSGFYAYAPSFTGGVSATAGDIDGDGDDDVITTPGPGMPVMINAQRIV